MNNYNGIIYKITNKINNKIYVGQTKNSLKERMYKHSYDAVHSKNSSSLLHKAMRKYGVENFEITPIDFASSPKELNDKEIYWINFLNTRDASIGYNICKGGEGGIGGNHFGGHHHTLETRKKMSESRMGKNNSNYGNHRIMPNEEKYKHSCKGEKNGMYGKTHSLASKQSNSIHHIGKKAFSNLRLDKVVMLYPEEGETLMRECSDWVKGNIHVINKEQRLSK